MVDCGSQVSQCQRGKAEMIKKERLIGEVSKIADYEIPVLPLQNNNSNKHNK